MKYKQLMAYYLIYSSLPLFFIFDFLNKYSSYFLDNFSYSVFVRGVYEILFLLFILLFLNRQKLQVILSIMILFAFFLVGQLIFFDDENYKFFYNLKDFNKYVFIFIVSLVISDIKYNYFFKIIKLFEYLFFFNSILIIFGVFFKIYIFQTYDVDYRYGYDGIIPAQNEATFFIIAGLIYFYYKVYYLNIKDKKWYIVFFSSLFIGTKGVYIFLIVLLLFHIYRSSLLLKIKVFLLVSILIISIYIIFFNEINLLFSFFYKSYEKDGLFTMLLSNRNDNLNHSFFKLINKWQWYNWFIGSQDTLHYYSEMDCFDIIGFWGFLGAFLYLYVWKKLVFPFKLTKKFNLFILFSVISLASFGGHFFSSAVNSLYYALIGRYIYETQKK